MERQVPLVEGEAYHIFNRGEHKQPIFIDEQDHRRFQVLLLLANSTEPIDTGNILRKYQGPTSADLFEREVPTSKRVDILAYALMPNHFHLVVRQRNTHGISEFMRKVCTAYSMYFNLRHDHSGTLFQGKFKSSHINTDPYFSWLFAYVHLNPISLVEPAWDERCVEDVQRAQGFIDRYAFSSYLDYYSTKRPERTILAIGEGCEYVDSKKDIKELLADYGRGSILFDTLGKEAS